ncbi:MAG: cytochrome c peroxidase [Methylocystis sp.]
MPHSGAGLRLQSKRFAIGMVGRTLQRNAPSLHNVGFKKYLFHDGRETDLGI